MLKRIFNHLRFTPWKAKTIFPQHTLDLISQKITESEDLHCGEIRIVIQSNLPLTSIFKKVFPRDAALQSFTELKIWDTEKNSGVLIFLLLADHAVEIIADRGFNQKVSPKEWENICKHMETNFKLGKFERGMVAGIDSINELIVQHFPRTSSKLNELSDDVVLK